jgi:ATP-dependent RNA helicase DHR2
MPEKVHTKFSDDSTPRSPTSTAAGGSKPNSQELDNGSQSNGYKKEASPGQRNGGVKRFRDGSPKPTTNPTQQIDKLQTKKQRRSSTENLERKSQSNGTATTRINGNLSQKQTSSLPAGQKTQKPNGSHQQPLQRLGQQHLLKAAKDLEKVRKELPIWSKKADIRWALRNNDVLLLNGETGSGKSTQTPQFLYTEPWCKKRTVKIENEEGRQEEVSVGGMIAITEPRRVAAITLARRVAREIGSSVEKGTEYGTVGYSVRFDSILPRGTKIKFLTEGMLLQEMLRDPHLRQYSAVIVDEIHERSVDVDLISGFLRKLVHGDKKGRGGIPLKVVIMSATLDRGGLEAFFGKPETRPKYMPGKNHGKILAPHLLEDMTDVDDDSGIGKISDEQSPQSSTNTFSSWEGISSSDEEPSPLGKGDKSKKIVFEGGPSPLIKDNVSTTNGLKGKSAKHVKGDKSKVNGTMSKVVSADSDDDEEAELEGDAAKNGVAVVYVQGRQYDVAVFYDVTPTPDYLDNMLKTILKLHTTERLPGDILAFLTGQEEIETLQSQLEHWGSQLVKGVPRMKVIPLYGSLSPMAQQEAFEKVKEKFTRKIVLATNIAETSVTVSGVHFVVDCGKSKVKQYRPRLGLESLLSRPISKTSAIQRAGRAGREAKGKCFRLYTAEDFKNLEADEKPEILRSDVIEAVLKMKARGVEDVLDFPLMDRPDVIAMEKALLQLHIMGAIDDNGQLTGAGTKMAVYPLPAVYGRVIVAAAESDCLLEIIDIIASLTTDSEIFLHAKSEDEQLAIEENRKAIQHPKGDILTYLKTMQLYANENVDRGAWCKKHNISVRAMKMAMPIRRQLRQICLKQKLLAEAAPPDPQPLEELSPENAERILKTFLKAFATKTAVLGGDGAYATTMGRNPIAIHPSSVLYGKKLEAIMFLEHVFTAKSYAKKVSAIQANWIAEALGA